MNERIREIVNHAGEYTDYDTGLLTEEFILKFTELIVRECANTAYQSLYEDRVFDDSPNNIRCNVMDAIKKHFGVEE